MGATWCTGFSLGWLLLLWSMDSRARPSVVTAHGLSSCGSWALMLGEAHWPKPSTLTRHHSNHLTGSFTTGSPGKEHQTNKPPPTGRIGERSNRDTTCPTTSQNPSCWHPSWLNKACTARMDSESEWWAKDNPETNPKHHKTASHVAELFSWVPLPYCSPPGRPFQ